MARTRESKGEGGREGLNTYLKNPIDVQKDPIDAQKDDINPLDAQKLCIYSFYFLLYNNSGDSTPSIVRS